MQIGGWSARSGELDESPGREEEDQDNEKHGPADGLAVEVLVETPTPFKNPVQLGIAFWQGGRWCGSELFPDTLTGLGEQELGLVERVLAYAADCGDEPGEAVLNSPAGSIENFTAESYEDAPELPVEPVGVEDEGILEDQLLEKELVADDGREQDPHGSCDVVRRVRACKGENGLRGGGCYREPGGTHR